MNSISTSVMRSELPLSLYVHLPWCVKKCPYCDFNSHEVSSVVLADLAYADALVSDINFEISRLADRSITSIFIGGGTPSLFSVEALEKIFNKVHSQWKISPEAEITLEANPGTTDADRFKGYRDLGINRLSIGVQSFDDNKLQKLGRIHDAGDAHRAIQSANEAGFDNVNIDLMFGLPNQTISEALEDVHTACSQAVTHISWYQLTLEPNTVFHKYPPALPDDDETWEMQRQGQAILAQQGFAQYEISAYAKPDMQCKHNLNYWQFGDYLGIGAGAHGKITDIKEHRINRFIRHRIPETYMQKAGDGDAIVEQKTVGKEDVILEFMMNVLRLNEGFSESLFSVQTGLEMQDIQAQLNIAIDRGFIIQKGKTIKPTKTGLNYLNDVLAIFMPAT
ncbi:MAG: putative oxygen-independent coproporphyrinogen III oxidase [Planctomycetota bacterium]